MAAVLTTLAWARRPTPGATPFAFAMAFVALATLNRLFFVTAPEDTLYFFARARIAALAFVPALSTIFVLAYVGHRRWSSPPRAWLFLIVPVAVTVLLFTYDQLFWSNWRVAIVGGVRNEILDQGPLWSINLLYAYTCFIATLGLLLRAILGSIHPLRSQTILLLIGWAIIMLTNMPFAIASLGRYIPNLTNISFVVGGVLFLVALQRQGFLDRVPLALQTVYQSMQDGVVVFDTKHRIMAMNPTAERYFKRTTEEIVGKSADETRLIHPDVLARLSAPEAAAQVEVTQDERTVEFDISHIIDRGEPAGHIIVMRDITERKQAQATAMTLTLEQERIRLLAGVVRDTSRELRAPLTTINTAVFMVQRATTAQERKERLAQIETQATYMTQIVDSLQLLADLDMRSSLRLSEFSIRDWLETLPDTVRELIERRKHKLVRDFDRTQQATITGDFYLLRAAIQQLLHNAALYTPSGGTITLKASQANGSIEVTVSDTGIGISPDALEAIFERFTKLDPTNATAGRGAGIGLSIVKKVVELHGGSVSASSEAGRGSAFTIRLPLQATIHPGLIGDTSAS